MPDSTAIDSACDLFLAHFRMRALIPLSHLRFTRRFRCAGQSNESYLLPANLLLQSSNWGQSFFLPYIHHSSVFVPVQH